MLKNNRTIWQDQKKLHMAIRQIAINNGTPNIMPSLNQMKALPGLESWVRKKEGGVKKLASKINMIVKPTSLPSTVGEDNIQQTVLKGEQIFVQNKNKIYPAIVLEKGKKPSELIVLMFNKKLTRKHVQYSNEPTSIFTWCWPKDIPDNLIKINV